MHRYRSSSYRAVRRYAPHPCGAGENAADERAARRRREQGAGRGASRACFAHVEGAASLEDLDAARTERETLSDPAEFAAMLNLRLAIQNPKAIANVWISKEWPSYS
jgi:hypothetical protein